jgi:site-specific recombinase XerD
MTKELCMTTDLTISDPNAEENNWFLIAPRWWQDRANAEKKYLVHKDSLYRLGRYRDWLNKNEMTWKEPDLAAYRDYLLNDRKDKNGHPRPLAAYTVQAHLCTIRARYRVILEDNATRDYFYSLSPTGMPLSDRKAFVDEIVQRIENAIKPGKSKVKLSAKQDVADAAHTRLTPDQIMALVRTPGLKALKGLRDTAILALVACTGIREGELVKLEVRDLRQTLGGELALQIRHGKGDKQRLVPYGGLSWCLSFVDSWLKKAGITEGVVFRGIYKGGKSIRKIALTTRAVIQIVSQYPVFIQGDTRSIQVHDLRRSYAKNLFLDGVDMETIRQNLGHADVKTTQGYIGVLDASHRAPKAVYAPPIDLIESL